MMGWSSVGSRNQAGIAALPLVAATAVTACNQPQAEENADSGRDPEAGIERTDGGDAAATDGRAGDAGDAGTEPALPLPSTCDPGVQFCNQAETMGLTDYGPAFGRGAAFVDLDGDGWDELWVTDSGSIVEGHVPTTGVYRLTRDGRWQRWDVGIDEAHLESNWSAAFGDIDNDGDPDLFLANGGYGAHEPAALYRNDLSSDGQMTHVTEEAGIDADPRRWWGASFADYDNDGDLDLVATNMIVDGFDPEDLVADTVVLYRNEGDGTFVEVSEQVGLPNPQGEVKNPVWADVDNDGDMDLAIGHFDDVTAEASNAGLFLNQQGGTHFEHVEREVFPGPQVTSGNLAFAIGLADFDQDGMVDFYLGRFGQQDYILLSNGDGTFQPLGPEAGLDMALGQPSDNETMPIENTMGLGLGDITGDGWPDILIGPGNPVMTGPPIVLCHQGKSLTFERCGEDFAEGAGWGRNHGVALSDVNHDGDVDVFWNLGGSAFAVDEFDVDGSQLPAFFVHHAPPAHPNTAAIKLEGRESNRSAIGARIAVSSDRVRRYAVRSQHGFVSQNSSWLTVSLGQWSTGTVRVRWPSGGVTEMPIHTEERIRIVEGVTGEHEP